LSKDCFVTAKDAEDVLNQFRTANPAEPRAYALWEPYVSKLLKQNPQAQVLIDSSRFPGMIVDVLVVNRAYLQSHGREVKDIVASYLEVAHLYQETPQKMIDLVRDDWARIGEAKKQTEALTAEEGAKVVQGIWWKNLQDNFGHFGLLPGDRSDAPPTLEEMINNVALVLHRTGVMSRAVEPAQLFDKSICVKLQEEKFDPTQSRPKTSDPLQGILDAGWRRLRPVETVQIEAVRFSRGSSAIQAVAESDLEEVMKIMKTFAQYYLEIRGHAGSTSSADRELAERRATEVRRWLQSKGLHEQRMRVQVVDPPMNGGEARVSFVVLQRP
jgi:outer membrane protein OmpA-like peptidoglycan-associated protein